VLFLLKVLEIFIKRLSFLRKLEEPCRFHWLSSCSKKSCTKFWYCTLGCYRLSMGYMCFAIRLDMHGLTRLSMLDGRSISFPLGLLYRKGLPMLHQLLDSSEKRASRNILVSFWFIPVQGKKSAIYFSLLNMVSTEIIAMDDTIIPFDFRTTKLWAVHDGAQVCNGRYMFCIIQRSYRFHCTWSRTLSGPI
jgi:hypothetical protein